MEHEKEFSNYSEFMKLMEVFNELSSILSTSESDYEKTDEEYIENGEDPKIQMVRAAVPYLDPLYAGRIEALIKFTELIRAIKDINQTEKKPFVPSRNNEQEMLKAVRKVSPKEYKQMIDLLIKFSEVNDIFNNISLPPQGEHMNA